MPTSTKTESFCERTQELLNTLHTRVQSVKATIKQLPEKSEQTLNVALSKVRTDAQSAEVRVSKVLTDLKLQAEHKAKETTAVISDWKKRREISSLNKRANRVELYAEDAIDDALWMIARAEEAVLEAALARVDAESVNATP